MSDCIFCKIIKGDIPCAKVFEDDKILAFLDIMPANKGHVLVVPKNHHETYTDLPKDALLDVFFAGQRIAKSVQKVTNCEGYNILMNSGKAAGQVVMHAHLHIIPKFASDKWYIKWDQEKYAQGEIAQFAEKIKKEMK